MQGQIGAELAPAHLHSSPLIGGASLTTLRRIKTVWTERGGGKRSETAEGAVRSEEEGVLHGTGTDK